MLDQIAAPVLEDINQIYESLKHSEHGQEVRELMEEYHWHTLSMIRGESDPWEKVQILSDLQEKLRERLRELTTV